MKHLNKAITLLIWSAFSVAISAQVTLGPTVTTFGVLAGSSVSNTGGTTVNANVGVSPLTAITGFPPGMVTNGTLYSAGAVAAQAQADLTSAFTTAMGLACPGGNNLTGEDLGGLTLTPGVYCFSNSAQLTGTLTLNAVGNQNAEFIFQVGSTVTTASGAAVVLINNAQAGNVFWEVGSSATVGTGASFVGNVMAQASVTLTTGAALSGRALARTGAVTLDTNTILVTPLAGSGPGGGGPSSTPAPSSLILVTLGAIGAAIYLGRQRRVTSSAD